MALCNNTMVIKMKIFLIISILNLLIFNSLSLAADNNRISKYERGALISLYLSTGGDQWTSNKGWKDGQLESDGFSYSGSECNWFGVLNEYLQFTRYAGTTVFDVRQIRRILLFQKAISLQLRSAGRLPAREGKEIQIGSPS